MKLTAYCFYALFLVLLLVTFGCIEVQKTSMPQPSPNQSGQTIQPKPVQPQTQPKEVELPYSWEEHNLNITVLEVVPAKEEHGIRSEGYQQYTVNFRYENLLSEDLEAPRGGAGLDDFKLKTDKRNTYKPRYVGGSPLSYDLRPKEAIVFEENYIFEIRKDETPVELLGYDEINGKLELIYIFELH